MSTKGKRLSQGRQGIRDRHPLLHLGDQSHLSVSPSCPYLDPEPLSSQVKALSLNLREAAQALLEVLKSRSHPRAMNAREILDAVSAASPGAVADVLASSINIPTNQKQASVVSCCVCARVCA